MWGEKVACESSARIRILISRNKVDGCTLDTFGVSCDQVSSMVQFSCPLKVICVFGFMTEYNGQWCCFVLTNSLLYDHWKEKIFFYLGERKPHTVVTVCDLVLVNLHFHYLLMWQFYCLPHVEAVECEPKKNTLNLNIRFLSLFQFCLIFFSMIIWIETWAHPPWKNLTIIIDASPKRGKS